jgi:peptidyl-prolyl cis-trans isomerase SurA
LAPTNKTIPEAKGLITADYQNYLEKQWIASLRSKYQFTVEKEVLSTVK